MSVLSFHRFDFLW